MVELHVPTEADEMARLVATTASSSSSRGGKTAPGPAAVEGDAKQHHHHHAHHCRRHCSFVVAILAALFLAASVLLFRYEAVAEFLRRHEEDDEVRFPSIPTDSGVTAVGESEKPKESKGGDLHEDVNADLNQRPDGKGGNTKPIPMDGGANAKQGVNLNLPDESKDTDTDTDASSNTAEQAEHYGTKDEKNGNDNNNTQHSPSLLGQLLNDVKAAKLKFDSYLQTDYGEFVSVFNTAEVRKVVTTPSKVSEIRIKRRMKMKVIEAQLKQRRRRQKGAAIGNVTETAAASTTYTWITGGHSAAAAHGNLLNQSYTVQLGQASRIVFESVGINFVSKNYAMGGTTSGPEISLCLEEIFGTDIDVLWWDYGMTDGHDLGLYWLYGNRAGVHPTFPALFAYSDHRHEMNAVLENHGLATFSLGDVQRLRTKFPDSDTHPNPSTLPPAVAWYMCNGRHENNEPCKQYKWKTNPPCDKARYQSSWHNGWKEHKFVGSVQAVSMVEFLIEAVAELDAREVAHADVDGEGTGGQVPSISDAYLQSLRAEEDADRRMFMTSSSEFPSGSTTNTIDQTGKREKNAADENGRRRTRGGRGGGGRGGNKKRKDSNCTLGFGECAVGLGNWSSFFLRGKSICHSARLPSEARYQGLVTPGAKKVVHGDGVHVEQGYHVGYDVGYASIQDLPHPKPDDASTPPMLTVSDRRQECTEPLQIDFKDAFIVRAEDGWMTGMYPTDEEVQVFSSVHGHGQNNVEEREGFIMICLQGCAWGKCPRGYVHLEELIPKDNGKGGNLTIMVDGQAVLGARLLKANCYALEGQGGALKFGPGTVDGRRGQYEVKFRVNKPASILFMSSVVVL